jgi:phenylpropionate dioxygenase-like ring-hydroxylating dioxygenase large terminal subunit
VKTSPSLSLDPVVRGAWHPVAVARDCVAGTLRPVTLVGEEVVLWRGTEGVHVWQDLCVHRGVRLSLGEIVDGCRVRCAYHGWTYDERGQCTSLPAHPSLKPPPRAQVRRYFATERAGLVWASLAESPDEVPSLAEADDAAFRAIPSPPAHRA